MPSSSSSSNTVLGTWHVPPGYFSWALLSQVFSWRWRFHISFQYLPQWEQKDDFEYATPGEIFNIREVVFMQVQVHLLEYWRCERGISVAVISGVSSSSSSSPCFWVGARLVTWILTSYSFSNSSSSLILTPWNFFFPNPASRYCW